MLMNKNASANGERKCTVLISTLLLPNGLTAACIFAQGEGVGRTAPALPLPQRSALDAWIL